MRKQLAALAVLFLAAHLPYLPPTLEDIDSVNFALGVRSFDVAAHQPHPPGYPVFIALAKASTAALHLAGVPAAEPRALAALSVAAAAALIPLLFFLYRNLAGEPLVAWWAMAMAVCSPLFWFTALRPLSDMTGLAMAVAAQVLLLGALRPADDDGTDGSRGRVRRERLLLAGAVLAGFAGGVRVQAVILTGPLLIAAVLWPGTGMNWRLRTSALIAAAAGAMAWLVPLIAASGGLDDYAAALGTQAGEDFSGVVMLWTSRQARVAADAILYSFFWPWGLVQLGGAVIAIAAVGFGRLGWRAPRAVALLLIAFAPYAVFHLLFHETITVRYALPLVLPVAYLAAFGAAALGRVGLVLTAAAIVVTSIVLTIPAARVYGAAGSPAFRVFDAMVSAGGAETAGGARTIGMHAVMRRVVEWSQADHRARLLRAPHGREWLALVEHWRKDPDAEVGFLADPRRTDLVLFDPHARRREQSMRWQLPEMPFVAGTRPGPADWYAMKPPGWMLERGWALTAEVGGITARDGLGPHVQPSVAWVRARSGDASMIVGGRHLGSAQDPPARLTVTGPSGQQLDAWDAAPGFFFRHVPLAAGTLAGSGYVPVRVSALAADGTGRPVRISLEQFDLQSPGEVMFGLVNGWHEPEYSPAASRAWRWMSESARIWIRPVGRDVTLTLAGESPLRYFDRAPEIRVLAAGVELARFTPSSDFTQDVTVPAGALAASGGLVVLESQLWFSPAQRGSSPDQRHLALRIYSIGVR